MVDLPYIYDWPIVQGQPSSGTEPVMVEERKDGEGMVSQDHKKVRAAFSLDLPADGSYILQQV